MCRPCGKELECYFQFRGRQWVSFKQRSDVVLPICGRNGCRRNGQGWWLGPGSQGARAGDRPGPGQRAGGRDVVRVACILEGEAQHLLMGQMWEQRTRVIKGWPSRWGVRLGSLGGGAELCTELGKLEEEPIQGRNWESCCAPYSWDVFVSSHGNVGAGGLNLRLSI